MNAAADDLIPLLREAVRSSSAAAALGEALDRVRKQLDASQHAMAWETVPLETLGGRLPNSLLSCWIFVIRAGAATGAERHPNSHQRSFSLVGGGTFELHDGEGWSPRPLVSRPDAPPGERWVSIPPGTWHRLFSGREPWGMVSFHTAAADELIEERPVVEELLDGETVRERYSNR